METLFLLMKKTRAKKFKVRMFYHLQHLFWGVLGLGGFVGGGGYVRGVLGLGGFVGEGYVRGVLSCHHIFLRFESLRSFLARENL